MHRLHEEVNQLAERAASDRQIQYVMTLLRRIGPRGWHDSDAGQGMGMPSEADLRKWDAKDVSWLIDSLKQEF